MFIYTAIVLDACSIFCAALLSWFFVTPESADVALYVALGAVTVILWVFIGSLLGGYQSYRAITDLDWLSKLSWGWVVLMMLIFGGLWAFKLSEDYSRLWLGFWLLLGWGVMVSWRALASLILSYLRTQGYDQKSIVIIGAGRLGGDVITKVQSEKSAGFEIVAAFDDDERLFDSMIERVPVLPLRLLSSWLQANHVDEVWFTLPLRAEARMRSLLHDMRHSTVNIRYIPDLSSLRLLNHAPREVLGISMLDLSVSPMSELGNRVVKWLEDKLLAAAILLLISPILMIVAIGVKLSSRGPIFYHQERVGLNGKTFMMLKFRSMPVDVEKDGVMWGQASAKTTTWFGRFIRQTSLDELPQFINVLLGDMSIVGPRPERTVFVDQFKDEIPGYMQKHMVKAGITGWAQIHGLRGDTCLQTRIQYDLWYIENWSLWLDIKIILMTLMNGLVHKNAR